MKTVQEVTRAFLFMLAWLPVLAATAHAAEGDAERPFTLKALAPGVYAAIALPRTGAGANAGFVIGTEAVAVIDTFFTESAAAALLAEIRRLTPLPVRYVVNTHHHIDHVAGNALFRRQGAILIGQRDMRDWVRSENLRLFGAGLTAERRAQIEALAPPELGYERELHLDLGQRRLVVRGYPGHTGADSVVLEPQASVLFAGDLAWHRSVPNLVDATVSDWIETLPRLMDETRAATIVPGHGEVGTPAEVAAFRGYLADLRAAVGRHLQHRLQGERLQAAALGELAPHYGEWAFFKSLSPRNVNDMTAELAGRKRTPCRRVPERPCSDGSTP